MKNKRLANKIKKYAKLLKKDRDYDFAFLFILERYKLKRMIESFQNSSMPHVGIEKKISEMQICVRLIDIILEEDAPFRTYMAEYSKHNYVFINPSGTKGFSELTFSEEPFPKFPVHINTKNARRFHKPWGANRNLELALQPELRRIKALHLYNKIRNRSFGWWW